MKSAKSAQQRWNERNPQVIAEATKKWKAKKININFYLDPNDAIPLMSMPGSINKNAKRVLLEALKGVEN